MDTKQLPKSFDELLAASDVPLLVDFWAEWCGPCHVIAPHLQQIAREYRGRLRVIKINVDEKPHIAGRYQIRGIPTLIIFDKGRIVGRESGALSAAALRSFVDRSLATAT